MKILTSHVVRQAKHYNALFLHGAMGRGSNWRGVAAKFCNSNPGWGARVADLRNHGDSQGFPGPHTLAAGGDDVLRLAAHLDESGEPLAALVGHSLGGRLALQAVLNAQDRGWPGLCPTSTGRLRLVLVDTSPGSLPATADVRNVLGFAEGLPPTIDGDWRTVKQLFLDAGFSEMLGSWIATSVRSAGQGRVSLMFDPATIRSMLDEYSLPAADAWKRMRELPEWVDATLVVGENGGRWHTPAVLDQLDSLKHEGGVSVLPLPTGHWVHVEDPVGMQRVLKEALH